MVKRIFLEEIIDRSHLSAFMDRLYKLTGLHIVPFNERGEAVKGEPSLVLGEGKLEIPDFEQLARRDFFTRADGAAVRVLKLTTREHLFGAALIGPYLEVESPLQVDGVCRLSREQIQAATEIVEQFFQAQLEVAVEKESITRKEKILSVLEEASNIMNSSLEFQNLLEFLMDIAIDITGATCGALLMKKEGKKYLEVACARGKYPQEVKKIRVPLGKGVTGWVAKNREALNVPNVLLEPRYIETPETIYSEMAVPLLIGEELLGVIAVDSNEMNAFSKEDCTTLMTLASMVTKVIENSRLLAASNQKLRELSRLFSISERLAEQTDVADLFDLVLSDAAEALSCKGLSLLRYDSDREDLFTLCNFGLPEELQNIRIPMGKGIHGWVAQQKQPLLISDATLDVTVVRHSFFDTYSRSTLCVPLLAGERLVGVMSAHEKSDKRPFSEDDQRLLNTIGRVLTSHLENQRLLDDSRRKLEYLTTLYKVSSSVSGTLNVNRLCNMILHQVQDVMNVENVSLMNYDPIKAVLTLDAAIGVPKKWVGTSQVKVGEGIAGWVAKHRQPLLLKDISHDERFMNRPSRMDYTTRSALSVPIVNNRTLLGVLNVNNKRSGSIFTEDDLNLLLGISGQISHAIANARLYERTEQQVAELSLIQELGKAINSSLDLDSVLNYFIDMTSRITESDKSSLMLFDDEQQELFVQVHRGFDPGVAVKSLTFKIGEGIAGRAAEQRRPMKVANTQEDPNYKKLPLGDEQKPLTLISAPLLNRDKLIGVINCERELARKGPYTAENLDLLDTLSSQASVAVENARLYHNLLNVYLETIRALAAAIDAKDSYTHGHSRRVTDLSVALAMAMRLNRDEVDTIRHAALLHDIGKIGISESILLKPGRLTDEEFEKIKSHPHIGAGILNSIEFLKTVCQLIEHHHERVDGKGYPDGLKADEIPIGSRIIMIADTFDAITSHRPYRKPLSFDEAFAEVKRCSGSQFDIKVVETFLNLRQTPFCPDWLRKDGLTEND